MWLWPKMFSVHEVDGWESFTFSPTSPSTHFLPSSPPDRLSVPLSPAEIIYHYIQHTDAPQLLSPGNACSHSAIKAKRHPLPPAPTRAREPRWKESGGEERDGHGREQRWREGDKNPKPEGRGVCERSKGGMSKRETLAANSSSPSGFHETHGGGNEQGNRWRRKRRGLHVGDGSQEEERLKPRR